MEDDSNNHLNEAINNRTMSTGAETPFSFVFSEGFDLGILLSTQIDSTALNNFLGPRNPNRSKS